MSTEPRAADRPTPVVLARVAPASPDAAGAAIGAAVAAGASMVELDLATLEAIGAPSAVPCVATVGSPAEADRAISLGAAALRVDDGVPERERIAALAAEHDVVLHVPFGRGAPATAALDVGALDGDAGDDLVGRLAALTDLSAAGRQVIATIGPVGPDDTATLAALAVARGAAILRVHEVAAAARSTLVVAALAAEHGSRR